jgi:diguanylate cyclase (GGDEF)-like protein
MASRRLAVFDPTGRLIADLAALAKQAHVQLVEATLKDMPPNCAAVLIAPAVAADLPPAPADGPQRWIVGDGSNTARVAGAAAQAGASGVLLTPVSVEALASIAQADSTSADIDLARARALIATSLVNLSDNAQETLHSVAEGFSAHDCIVWWRDGAQMVPTAAREAPNEIYRTQIAGAARVAAVAQGTVLTSGPLPRSIIAEALRSSPTEVAGLVAIVSDSGRRFTAGERTDLKAIAARLTRELTWLSSHRRLVAEGERLLAASLHDPLTGAMARGAFEQTIAHEVAAAGRRKERLTLAVIDVVGLRKINLQYRHTSGDEVLAQVASRIRATVRGNDPIGRLGGDEIAVLLVGATEEQAALVVRKLIYKIQSEPIKIDGSTEIAIQVRAVLTELAIGERSGESAVARCYAALRTATIGDASIIPSDQRPNDSDASADTGSLSAGTIVGGTYRVVHELSRGAMGVVYRGEDLGLNRAVAIKVLRSDLASDRELVARFRAEAGILASLHHPNLVQVYALGEHAGDVYFVMELVEGQPLSEVLRNQLEQREWFPTAAVAQITMEIADALDAMHALGLIHRDVKPANILLDRERDRAVLVDVGVAVKAGDQRDAAGTPGFAAPESFLEPTDAPTTDVYGLAATAYCMLTGRPPFGSGPAPQVVQRQISEPLTPPSQLRFTLSEAVDVVLAKGLHPSTKRRYGAASTFAIALGRALERLSADHVPERAETPDPVKTAEALLRVTGGEGFSDELPEQSMPGMRLITGQVRAAHLRVLSRLLQHHLGEGGMAKIVNETPNLALALSPTLAPHGWVDLVDLVSALDRARERVPSQLVARKVGRGTMSAMFPHLFGADPSSLPAETVITALPTCWNRFHDWGGITVDVEPNRAIVVLDGYAGSVEVCALVEAELERIVELTGAREVNAIHKTCACTGDERCEFSLAWTSVMA